MSVNRAEMEVKVRWASKKSLTAEQAGIQARSADAGERDPSLIRKPPELGGAGMSGMAEVLAAHQKVSMGMTSGSPDTCKCGERVYPERDHDIEVTLRRDVAFAAHQAAMLTTAGFGPVKEAAAVALDEAADELARLPYVKPGAEGRDEYERILAVRRGDSDKWLRARAAAVRGEG